jgi:hypothetical protein
MSRRCGKVCVPSDSAEAVEPDAVLKEESDPGAMGTQDAEAGLVDLVEKPLNCMDDTAFEPAVSRINRDVRRSWLPQGRRATRS